MAELRKTEQTKFIIKYKYEALQIKLFTKRRQYELKSNKRIQINQKNK